MSLSVPAHPLHHGHPTPAAHGAGWWWLTLLDDISVQRTPWPLSCALWPRHSSSPMRTATASVATSFHSSSCVPPPRTSSPHPVMAADAEDAYDEIHPGATAGGQGRASSSAGVRVCPCTHTHTWRGGGRREEVLPSVHFAAASTPLNFTRSQAKKTSHDCTHMRGLAKLVVLTEATSPHTSASTTLDLRLHNGRLDIITLKPALLVSDVKLQFSVCVITFTFAALSAVVFRFARPAGTQEER